MPEAHEEQRNIYRGEPARAGCESVYRPCRPAADSSTCSFDTGNPYEVIIDAATMRSMQWHTADRSESNFGIAEGGWLQIAIPEIGFDSFIVGYANDKIAAIVKRSDRDFDGLIGLPFLRMLEYGGDRGYFWIRAE